MAKVPGDGKRDGWNMAGGTGLNAANLEALGAARLAALLIEVSTGDAAMKRRLRLELAGAAGPEEAARQVAKRITTIARSRSEVGWDRERAFVADLAAQLKAIRDQVAPGAPETALDLAWRLLGLAESVHARVDDSNGAVNSVFHATVEALPDLAAAAGADPEAQADRCFEAIRAVDYGQCDELIATMAPALGASGFARLKQLLAEFAQTPAEPEAERRVLGWNPVTGETLYVDAGAARGRRVRWLLEQIADAEGDVDGYIAQQDRPNAPQIAAEVALRLLGAGRAAEALAALQAASARPGSEPLEWWDAKIATLEALGRGEEAQTLRWERFEADPRPQLLRDYLKRLPDFEDMEAEARALALVRAAEDFDRALEFLVAWPALDHAADLALDRAEELEGDMYFLLAPAAEALEPRHPLAATLMLRAMIDFTLEAARTSRYKHAARHLATCRSLATRIEDFGRFETHTAFATRLRAEHGKKRGFWQLAD